MWAPILPSNGIEISIAIAAAFLVATIALFIYVIKDDSNG